MERVFSYGLILENIQANTKMTENMDMESSSGILSFKIYLSEIHLLIFSLIEIKKFKLFLGVTGENIKGNGRTENNMEKENFITLKQKP